MIKLIRCLHRLPHLTLEEFHAHWLEHHAQLVRRVKGIRSYVQYDTLYNNPMERPELSSAQPFDGFGAACWDSLDAYQTEMEKGSDFKAVLEDEKLFVDHTRSITCLTQERIIVEVEGVSPYVLVECHRHRPDLDRATFQNSWLNIHGAYGRDIYAQGLMSGFVQNHVVSHETDQDTLKTLGIDLDTFDGIGMAYFESMAKFKKMVSLPVVKDESFQAEDDFDDHERMLSVLTKRHAVKNIVR